MDEMEEIKEDNVDDFFINIFKNFILSYSALICPVNLIFLNNDITVYKFENAIEILLLTKLLIKLKQLKTLDLEEFIEFLITIFYLFYIILYNLTDYNTSYSFSIAKWFRLIRTIILIIKLLNYRVNNKFINIFSSSQTIRQ